RREIEAAAEAHVELDGRQRKARQADRPERWQRGRLGKLQTDLRHCVTHSADALAPSTAAGPCGEDRCTTIAPRHDRTTSTLARAPPHASRSRPALERAR